MSFSTEFVATSKVKAKAAIKQQLMPEGVRQFLLDAVEALPAADEERKPEAASSSAQPCGEG